MHADPHGLLVGGGATGASQQRNDEDRQSNGGVNTPASSSGGGGSLTRFKGKRYSEAVEKALSEVCPSSDPIDSPDFDPIAFINKKFPDEDSLDKLPAFHDEVVRKLQTTETDLLDAVKIQATTATSAAKDLDEARDAVVGLYARVAEIKRKAKASEEMVNSLCSNIRQLDTAKTNITTSIRTLRSVQLWMLSTQELNAAFARKDYAKCYDALRQSQSFSELFEEFRDVPKIKELNEKLNSLCRQLEFHVKNNVIGDMSTIDEDTLREACRIVDILGPDSVAKVRQRFIQKELEVYHLRFKRGTEDSKLERTERRYSFMRNLLDSNDHLFLYVFPRHWCVLQELCVEFCIQTHNELTYTLKESAGNIDVAVLVFILQKTIEVEREMTSRSRWRDDFEGRKELPEYKFQGMILRCFDNHMGLYVQHEDRAMEKAILEQAAEEDPVAMVAPNVIQVGATLSSADDLFVFIKESLKRALSLSQQRTLIDMIDVWRKHLVRYANILSSTTLQPPTNLEEERHTCLIINTADLCMTTSQALGEELVAKCDTAEPSDVSLDEAVEAFSSLYSNAILAVVVGIEKSLAPSIGEFASGAFMANLSSKSDALDESAYVAGMRKVLQERIQNSALALQPTFLRFLLDKIATTVIPRFTSNLFRLRRLSELSINQMRVDCAGLERLFLSLPNTGNPDRFPTSMLTNYMRLVRKEFDRMNRSLKVLQCEANDKFVDVYYELTLPENRSVQNMSRLLELKGVKREDLRPYIAALSRRDVPESTKRDQSMNVSWESDERILTTSIKSKFEKLSAATTSIQFLNALKARVGKGLGGEKEDQAEAAASSGGGATSPRKF